VIVGDRTVTQEQRGEEELVTAYEVQTGRRLWEHSDAARYFTTIAGEGPRATPTIVSNRVYALGATGILNCLELESGKKLWTRNIALDAGSSMPGWGFSGSPLAYDGKVVVSAGGSDSKSLIAYAGTRSANYSSPVRVLLSGRSQLLMFNSRFITGHAADTGAVLWEYPWGIGQPHVALPVVVSSNQVVFSSGYGVGSEKLAIEAAADGSLAARQEWKSLRLKAKFANFVEREGNLYGLDDGILTCVDVRDGTQHWKEGRYGHGQLLQLKDLMVVMAENGGVVLLAPTPEAPNELGRFAVFGGKTWNPPAMSGEFLLLRNDLEAACLRLSVRAAAAGGKTAGRSSR
jgi:outer membrane protein assembly factor BamB